MKCFTYALLLCTLLAGASLTQAQVIFCDPIGQATNAIFGSKAVGIHDINGDGRGDVLVGSPQQRFGTPSIETGAAFVFSGATGELIRTITSPDGRIGGEFGRSVLGIDDVTGDGIGDYMVGSFNPPKIHCFSGATGEPHYAFEGDIDRFGLGNNICIIPGATPGSMRYIAAGSPYAGSQDGRVFVFDPFTAELVYTIELPDQRDGAQFGNGNCVAGVPDLNNDGIGEVLVGVPNWYYNYHLYGHRGRAYLFSGADGSLLRSIQAPIWPPFDFGQGVAGIPDINGDGAGDYAVSSTMQLDQGADRRGVVFVYSGATGDILFTIRPYSIPTYQFGYHMSGSPDLDGDGRGELIIGSARDSYPGMPQYSGAAYVISGRTGSRIRTLLSPSMTVGAGSFGVRVELAPDASHDGRLDLLIGSFDCASMCPFSQLGRIYLFHSCAADFNYDGIHNSQDFFDFLSAFFQSWPGGDFNRDALFNSQDFFDFLEAFFQGC